MTSTAVLIYQLRIALSEVAPPLWRVIEVPSDFSLDWLHDVIQWSMGWEHEHEYRFFRGEFAYVERPQVHLLELGKELDATQHSLEKVFGKRGRYLRYVYDMVDSWWHHLWLEDVFAAAPETAYPRLVDGARACPPEGSGGVADYRAYLRGELDDENASWEKWRDFDPEDFDAGPRPFPNANIYVPAQEPSPPKRRIPFDADAKAMLRGLAPDVEEMLAAVDDDPEFRADLRRALEDVVLVDDALPPKTADTLAEARSRGLAMVAFLLDCVRRWRELIEEYSTAPFHAADLLGFWRVEEAVEVFAAVIVEAPEDAEGIEERIMRAMSWVGDAGVERLVQMLEVLPRRKRRMAVDRLCREGVRDDRIVKVLRREMEQARPGDTHAALLVSEYGDGEANELLLGALDEELEYLLERSAQVSDEERARHADYALLLSELLVMRAGVQIRGERAKRLEEVRDFYRPVL